MQARPRSLSVGYIDDSMPSHDFPALCAHISRRQRCERCRERSDQACLPDTWLPASVKDICHQTCLTKTFGASEVEDEEGVATWRGGQQQEMERTEAGGDPVRSSSRFSPPANTSSEECDDEGVDRLIPNAPKYTPETWFPCGDNSSDDAFENITNHLGELDKIIMSRASTRQARGFSFSGVPSSDLCAARPSTGHQTRNNRRSTIAETVPRERFTHSPSHNLCSTPPHLYRLRSFSISSKGVVNEGDVFKSRNNSSTSTDSAYDGSLVSELWQRSRGDSLHSHFSGSTTLSDDASVAFVPVYRISVLGHFGVGKSTLIRQLLTSDYVWSRKDCMDDVDEVKDNSVSVLLEQEESVLEFVESTGAAAAESVAWLDNDVTESSDAFVIVYSVLDRQSFHHAIDLLYTIRKQQQQDTPIILVANKIDIIRSKEIAREEGQAVARSYTCKYAEVSSMLHMMLDELLVGIISQIRLHERRNSSQSNADPTILNKDGCRLQKVARGFLHRLLRREKLSSSCDNLLVL